MSTIWFTGIQGWDHLKTMPGNVGSALPCSGGVQAGTGTINICTCKSTHDTMPERDLV